mgnify:CR=1 FL=1
MRIASIEIQRVLLHMGSTGFLPAHITFLFSPSSLGSQPEPGTGAAPPVPGFLFKVIYRQTLFPLDIFPQTHTLSAHHPQNILHPAKAL